MKLEYYKDLIIVLTQKELKVRYKNTFLGYIWSIANPLFYACIYFVAFKIFMRIQIENYTLFLIAALFPWQWFANSIGTSPTIFIANASLVKKVNFPRETVVLADIFNNMIHLLLSIPVIVIFLLFYSKSPSFSWFYGIPVLLLIQFFIIYGLALAIASLNLFFRDLERIVVLIITFLFFLTPIFYSANYISDKAPPKLYSLYLWLNPLAPLIISWRNLFLEGSFEITLILKALVSSLVIFLIGYHIYKTLRWRFAEIL